MNKQKDPKQQIVKTRLGRSSVVQCFPKMFKALESTPSTTEKNEQTKQNYPKVKTIKVSRRVREDTGNNPPPPPPPPPGRESRVMP